MFCRHVLRSLSLRVKKPSVINSKSKQVVKSTLWLEISLLQLQCFIINAANLFHFTQSEKRLFSTTKFNFTTTSESWSSIKHHGNTGLIEMKRRTALKQGEMSSKCFNFMRRNCFGKNRHHAEIWQQFFELWFPRLRTLHVAEIFKCQLNKSDVCKLN